MPSPDRTTVIAAWIRQAQERRVEDFWAWEVVCQAAAEATADEAWALLVDLLRAVPDELVGNVGVGLLERMLPRLGSTLIDRIEFAAHTDARFREALGAVWLRVGDLPADIEARVVAASGGAIEPFTITPEEEAAMDAELERELARQRQIRNRQADV